MRNLTLCIILSSAVWIASCASHGPSAPAGEVCVADSYSVVDRFQGARRGRCDIRGPDHVRLNILPEDSGYINPSPWYAFKLMPTRPTSATITLRYKGGEHRYEPKMSFDGLTWAAIDDAQVEISSDKKTVTLRMPLDTREIYVAAQELITPPIYDRWNTAMVAQHDVQLTQLGQSLRQQPIHMLRSESDSRDVLFLLGRQHPPEVSGAFAFLAFFEALMADTDTANAFRERFDIVAIPLLNPDGVIGGNWRHNLGGTDLNRDWGPFQQPETQLVRDLLDDMDASGQKIRVFLDFHSTTSNAFYTQDDDNPTQPPHFTRTWLANARPRVPYYDFSNDENPTDKLGVSKNYMYLRYGIPSTTYEVGDETDRDSTQRAAAVFADELMKLMLQQEY